ncbi:hypothetical protein R3P38DRAFT_3236089 [Favolaschia claudopus]|uniref:Uncharacterized protein n=1 Tax=Favolaschia claudopus TaxID=2862362 RepID=A0AAV9ZCZ9_9AGAR
MSVIASLSKPPTQSPVHPSLLTSPARPSHLIHEFIQDITHLVYYDLHRLDSTPVSVVSPLVTPPPSHPPPPTTARPQIHSRYYTARLGNHSILKALSAHPRGACTRNTVCLLPATQMNASHRDRWPMSASQAPLLASLHSPLFTHQPYQSQSDSTSRSRTRADRIPRSALTAPSAIAATAKPRRGRGDLHHPSSNTGIREERVNAQNQTRSSSVGKGTMICMSLARGRLHLVANSNPFCLACRVSMEESCIRAAMLVRVTDMYACLGADPCYFHYHCTITGAHAYFVDARLPSSIPRVVRRVTLSSMQTARSSTRAMTLITALPSRESGSPACLMVCFLPMSGFGQGAKGERYFLSRFRASICGIAEYENDVKDPLLSLVCEGESSALRRLPELGYGFVVGVALDGSIRTSAAGASLGDRRWYPCTTPTVLERHTIIMPLRRLSCIPWTVFSPQQLVAQR